VQNPEIPDLEFCKQENCFVFTFQCFKMPCVYLFFLEYAELHIIALRRREYQQDTQTHTVTTHLYSRIPGAPETHKHAQLEPLKRPLASSSQNARQTFCTRHTPEGPSKILLRTTWTFGVAPLNTHLFLCLQIIHASKVINKFTPLFQCPGIEVLIQSHQCHVGQPGVAQ
jgi:hypothetical protein